MILSNKIIIIKIKIKSNTVGRNGNIIQIVRTNVWGARINIRSVRIIMRSAGISIRDVRIDVQNIRIKGGGEKIVFLQVFALGGNTRRGNTFSTSLCPGW